MHRRIDFPAIDPQQHHYHISSGLEMVRVRSEAQAPPVETRQPALAR